MTDLALRVEPDVPIGMALAAIGKSAVRQYEEALEPTGLKPRHLRVLAGLRRGASTQQLLCGAVQTDANQLVAVLNELETADLVRRRRDPDDRRRHIVELSATGAEKLHDAKRRVNDVEQRLLAGLDAQSRAQFREMLEKLATNLGAAVDCDGAAESP